MQRFFWILALGGVSLVSGQETIFGVPSGEVSDKGEWFFQHQSTLRAWRPERRWVQSNAVAFGVAKGLEVDLTMLNLDAAEPSAVRGAFGFKYASPLGKIGTTPIRFVLGDLGSVGGAPQRFGNWAYSMLAATLPATNTKVSGGAFHGTREMYGENTVGFLGGLEQPVGERWVIEADWFSGTHEMAYFIPGFGFRLTEHWTISAGYQLPNPGSSGYRAVVAQLSRTP